MSRTGLDPFDATLQPTEELWRRLARPFDDDRGEHGGDRHHRELDDREIDGIGSRRVSRHDLHLDRPSDGATEHQHRGKIDAETAGTLLDPEEPHPDCGEPASELPV